MCVRAYVVCVYVCVRAREDVCVRCVRACTCVCMYVRVRGVACMRVYVCMCACVRAYHPPPNQRPEWNSTHHYKNRERSLEVYREARERYKQEKEGRVHTIIRRLVLINIWV